MDALIALKINILIVRRPLDKNQHVPSIIFLLSAEMERLKMVNYAMIIILEAKMDAVQIA